MPSERSVMTAQAVTELARGDTVAAATADCATVGRTSADFLVDLDDRFAADQAAHGNLVAEEPDVLEDRDDLGTANFLGQRQNSPLFRRKVILRPRRFDIKAVIREIIERDTDRSRQPERVVQPRARLPLEDPRDLRIAHAG